MARLFQPLSSPTSWRRMAPHAWGRPDDPSVYGILDFTVDRAIPYLDALSKAAGTRIRFSHLVTKGIANAIAMQPETNAIISRRRIHLRSTVDVFVQVATDQGRDLSGTKIASADALSLATIARELEVRAARVRQHRDPGVERTKSLVQRLPNPLLGRAMRFLEYLLYDMQLDLSRFGVIPDQFGSAMVSNVGTFGTRGMTVAFAPLVPMSRCPIVILVGEVQRKPVVEGDQIVIRSVLPLGCTFDHRVLDGAQATMMAGRLRDIVEDPERTLGPVESPRVADLHAPKSVAAAR